MDNRTTLTNVTGCALGLAALIAAAALLIFALVFAGMIRPGWMTNMGPGMGPMMDLGGRGEGLAVATTVAVPAGETGTPSRSGATVSTATMPASAARAGAATGGPATAGAAGAAGAADKSGTPATPADPAFTPDALPNPTESSASAADGQAARITASRVVEDWTGYADDAALADTFSVNLGWSENTLDLYLTEAEDFYGGESGITAHYVITAPLPNDYVGFERDLEVMEDWSGYTHLALRVDPAPSNRPGRLVIQWYEATGEVWTNATPLADIAGDGPVMLRIPLTGEAWTWADWSDKRNQKIDLKMVTRFGLFIGHGGPTEGTIRFGPLQVIRTAE